MRLTFNEEAGIEIYPDNSAEVVALRHWAALHPVRTISEGTLNPVPMRPAAAVIIKESTNGK